MFYITYKNRDGGLVYVANKIGWSTVKQYTKKFNSIHSAHNHIVEIQNSVSPIQRRVNKGRFRISHVSNL